MSEEKIISINPTDAQPPKKKRPSKVRIVVFVLLIVLVAAVLCVIFLDEALNLDKARRFFRYSSASDDEGFGEYTFAAGGADSYVSFDGGLAVASQSGLAAYAASGAEVGIAQANFTTPAAAACKQFVVGYDVGGTTLAVLNQSGQTIYSQKTEGALFDLDASKNGYVCYAMSGSEYKTVLVTLNSKQQEIYRWNSNSQYMNCCAVSPNGKQIAAVGLGQTDAQFSSTAVILRTDETEIHAQLSLGNQIIYDLRFLDNNTICAFGESATVIFSADGEELGRYAYDGSTLTDFSTDDDSIALSLYQDMNGSYNVVTLDDTAQVLADLTVEQPVLSLSVCGKYVAVLTSRALTVYHRTLEVYAETTDFGAANRVLMRDDGTAILIGSGRGSLYLPD